MKYVTLVSTITAVASALAVRQISDVDVILLPSYGCPGADPIARILPNYLDGGCHSIGGFESTQTNLTAPVDTKKQTLTFYADDTCGQVATVLSNAPADRQVVASGQCVSAPYGKSFAALRYEACASPA